MKREDYVFCIGFQGNAAVVDRQAKAAYGKLTTRELAGKGLFKAALCSALYSGNAEDMMFVISAYNAAAGTTFADAAEMKRLLGASDPPEGVQAVVLV
jgi:hypothetical protein